MAPKRKPTTDIACSESSTNTKTADTNRTKTNAHAADTAHAAKSNKQKQRDDNNDDDDDNNDDDNNDNDDNNDDDTTKKTPSTETKYSLI
jgi:hypothetical protein